MLVHETHHLVLSPAKVATNSVFQAGQMRQMTLFDALRGAGEGSLLAAETFQAR